MKKKDIIVFCVIFAVCVIVILAFAQKESEFSIGIYTGESPFDLKPYEGNPVLTGDDVDAESVADPFIVKEDKLYMFFEVLNKQGDIGLAVSEDGLKWSYEGIVLDGDFHLSYPYVFKFEDEYYMIPESSEINSVRLYKAVNFPIEWEFVKVLVKGNYVDPSILRHDGKFWLFMSDLGDNLYLYYSDNLSRWVEHPENPIIREDANIARCGGRVLILEGRMIRFGQDGRVTYGNKVRGFEIIELDAYNYEEKEIGIVLKADKDWSRKGMHHIDFIDGIAAVDGVRTKVKLFGIESRFLSELYDLMIRILNSII
ncbi:hypothetical protein KY345_01015 [Candidatus Woesearchaeota archaeon]|nr:hypothetical protein [Candidatus Woesearchaeota archaeon]